MSQARSSIGLVALLALAALAAVSASAVGEPARGQSEMGLYSMPRVHSTSSVSRVHPLLHYEINRDDGSPLLGFHPETPANLRHKQDELRRHRAQHLLRNLKDESYENEADAEEAARRYDHNFPSSVHSVFPSVPHRVSKSGHIVQPYPDTLLFSIRLPSDEEDSEAVAAEFGGAHLNSSRLVSHSVPNLHTLTIEDVKLRVMTDIFDWDAPITDEDHFRVSIRDGDDEEIATVPRLLASYQGSWSTPSSEGWLVLTFHADGRFQLTAHVRGGETYQVDLVEHHFADMDQNEFDSLHDTAFARFRTRDTSRADGHMQVGGHGMTVFTYGATKKKFGLDYKCGTQDAHNPHEHDEHEHDHNHKHDHSSSSSHSHGIDLDRVVVPSAADANASPVSRHLLTVSQWTSCWSGQAVTQRVSIGIMADTAYYKSYSSDSTTTQAAIAQLFSLANTVYLAQLNVVLVNSALILYATTSNQPRNSAPTGYTGPNFNEQRTCSITIGSKLTYMTMWKAAVTSNNAAVWHLLTNCYSSGVVGLSYIGQLCNGYAIGISSRVTNHWLTFAHEIGHNFGAQHTIGLGGIMDYSDGKYPTGTGQYMFHPNNKAEICPYISTVFKATHTTRPYCNKALTYSWTNGTWSNCTCAGTQTRTVTCTGSDGNTYETSKCTSTVGATPATSQTCAAPSTCYSWSTGNYSTCSATCGGGVETRNVTCLKTVGTVVSVASDSSCSNSTKPATSVACNTAVCASSGYYWYTTASTTCSASCGSGLQYRVVYCAATGSITKVSSTLCASAGTQPAALIKCNTQAC